MIAACLLFMFLTATASALHGGNYFGKAWIVAGHVILSLLCGWFAPIGAAVFWLFLRSGENAKAEIGFLRGEVPLRAVRASYPPAIGYVVAEVIEWCQYHPWPAMGSTTHRRQQEICTGFVLGLILSIFFIILPDMVNL